MNKKYLIIAFLLAIYGVVQSQNIQQRIDKVGDSKAYRGKAFAGINL